MSATLEFRSLQQEHHEFVKTAVYALLVLKGIQLVWLGFSKVDRIDVAALKSVMKVRLVIQEVFLV